MRVEDLVSLTPFGLNAHTLEIEMEVTSTNQEIRYITRQYKRYVFVRNVTG